MIDEAVMEATTFYERFEDFVVNFFFRLGCVLLPVLAVLAICECGHWVWHQIDFLSALPF